MTALDARGLSCPEPVVMISQAMASNANAYDIIVDNPTARENVSRFAAHKGCKVAVDEKDGEYTLHITK